MRITLDPFIKYKSKMSQFFIQNNNDPSLKQIIFDPLEQYNCIAAGSFFVGINFWII